MRVLVTGCSGHLGRVLIPRLLSASGIRGVIGLDIVKPAFKHPRFAFVRADMRDANLAHHFADIDALVHLAFVVMQSTLNERRDDRALMRAINVDGSINIFNLAAAAGVKTVIHLSSAAVYALPNANKWIDETQPRRALAGFGYAEDKVALEEWLDRYQALHRHLRLVRLRPHIILGPGAHPVFKTLLRLPFYPRVASKWQCVHEDDVVHAIRLALFSPVQGSFNLACADAGTYYDMQRAVRRFAVPIAPRLMQRGLNLAWHRFGWGTDPSWAAGIYHRLTLDIGHARSKLGWTPRHSFTQTCRATLIKNKIYQ